MTNFNSEKYKNLITINNKRSELAAEVNTAWTPLDKCIHIKLYEAQSELINLWVKENDKKKPDTSD